MCSAARGTQPVPKTNITFRNWTDRNSRTANKTNLRVSRHTVHAREEVPR